MIKLSNLTKRFGDLEAVRNVSLEVPDGAFLVLVGPSGCGKSTMLRMLAGLEMPSAGSITFAGKTVADGEQRWTIEAAKRHAGLVFQSYALWPHMTVAGNVEWPLKVAKWGTAERHARVQDVLGFLAIDELAGRYPSEISGGQQQRVAIARMIAPRPKILLFDEPLSNLDAKLRVDMRAELLKIHRATGATSVYVTHDQVEAMTMASHVAVMNGGRVEQFGAPAELVADPLTTFVASFLGTPPSNLLPVAIGRNGELLGSAQIVDETSADRPASVMYRAEDIRLAADGTEGTLALDFVEASPIAGRHMVTGTLATGTADGTRVTAIVDHPPDARPGDRVHFRLPDRPAAFFDDNGKRIASYHVRPKSAYSADSSAFS